MKKNIIYCLLLLLSLPVYSQNLILKGRIRCQNQAAGSSRGAENIIVVPAFMPLKTTVTASDPAGYFELNTGIPFAALQDKIVVVYAVSKCKSCKEKAKRVIISEDQDRKNRNDGKRYVTIKEWMLETNCEKAELRSPTTDSLLAVIIKQPGQDLEKVSVFTVLTGTPAFLNFLTNLITVVGVLPNAGTFRLQSLAPGKMHYGQLSMASPLFNSANTGFNFAPSRDMSEAVFWNPSAIAFSRKPVNISLLSNIRNNIKLGGFYRVNDKLSVGLGGIYTSQDERRSGIFVSTSSSNTVPSDSVIMKLKEYAVLISAAYKLSDKFSIGITARSTWQDFNNPNKLFIAGNGLSTFTDSAIKKQNFDVDISATYKISGSFQAGLSLMNLIGNKLHADAFVPGQAIIPMQKQRSFGLGLLYRWQRFNAGADILVTEDGFYDAAFGINYVPFNNALISAGITVKQLGYSFAFRIKHFRLAYINDNDWLINERRTGKSKILNGRIHGGFVFDLNTPGTKGKRR